MTNNDIDYQVETRTDWAVMILNYSGDDRMSLIRWESDIRPKPGLTEQLWSWMIGVMIGWESDMISGRNPDWLSSDDQELAQISLHSVSHNSNSLALHTHCTYSIPYSLKYHSEWQQKYPTNLINWMLRCSILSSHYSHSQQNIYCVCQCN